LDLAELPTEDERNRNVYGDRKTYCVGAQTIGDDDQVGMATICIISTLLLLID
jgi:hypothetical protein